MIVKENSGKGQLDIKGIFDIAMAFVVSMSSFYIANTELVNNLIGDKISPDLFALATTLLAYVTKKIIKDYGEV